MDINEGLSYDDVLLIPSYSEVLPENTDVSTRLVRDIRLKIPIISAAMDTVTEDKMAIAIALNGGVGVIHRNLVSEEQARQIVKVKRYLNWIIEDPVCIESGSKIHEARKVMEEFGVTGLPVLNAGLLVGIITARDLKFNNIPEQLVDDVMTRDPVVETGIPTVETAKAKFNKHRIEKLPVTNDRGHLTGLITVRDLEKKRDYPNAALDSSGNLIVGAALGTEDWKRRLPLLIQSRVDFVVVDSAHGSSSEVLKTVSKIVESYPDVPVIGGNVADSDGARRMIEAGAEAVKVGVGPGSICTTRIIAGIGVPQLSAVSSAVEVCDRHKICLIADGGIKYSGDICKALGAGASSVMLGNLLAGLKESPGNEIIFEGRIFKTYRGMGSIGAIKQGGADRYRMSDNEVPVPEGIEGRIPYKGELVNYVHQLVMGIRKGMGYTGCNTIENLKKYRKFIRITPAGLRESHVHDVYITQEAPNYTRGHY